MDIIPQHLFFFEQIFYNLNLFFNRDLLYIFARALLRKITFTPYFASIHEDTGHVSNQYCLGGFETKIELMNINNTFMSHTFSATNKLTFSILYYNKIAIINETDKEPSAKLKSVTIFSDILYIQINEELYDIPVEKYEYSSTSLPFSNNLFYCEDLNYLKYKYSLMTYHKADCNKKCKKIELINRKTLQGWITKGQTNSCMSKFIQDYGNYSQIQK